MASFTCEIAVRTMWGEARNQNDAGLAAVAWVLRNRLYSGKWGHDLAGVCFWPEQFSCWNADCPERVAMVTVNETDKEYARCHDTLLNVFATDATKDPINGAMYYFQPSAKLFLPNWAVGMEYVGTFGTQRFYKEMVA
jgi:spore germination cell wall hydrolase CwlJ-like protein